MISTCSNLVSTHLMFISVRVLLSPQTMCLIVSTHLHCPLEGCQLQTFQQVRHMYIHVHVACMDGYILIVMYISLSSFSLPPSPPLLFSSSLDPPPSFLYCILLLPPSVAPQGVPSTAPQSPESLNCKHIIIILYVSLCCSTVPITPHSYVCTYFDMCFCFFYSLWQYKWKCSMPQVSSPLCDLHVHVHVHCVHVYTYLWYSTHCVLTTALN